MDNSITVKDLALKNSLPAATPGLLTAFTLALLNDPSLNMPLAYCGIAAMSIAANNLTDTIIGDPVDIKLNKFSVALSAGVAAGLTAIEASSLPVAAFFGVTTTILTAKSIDTPVNTQEDIFHNGKKKLMAAFIGAGIGTAAVFGTVNPYESPEPEQDADKSHVVSMTESSKPPVIPAMLVARL